MREEQSEPVAVFLAHSPMEVPSATNPLSATIAENRQFQVFADDSDTHEFLLPS
jgi:hypothetical protein